MKRKTRVCSQLAASWQAADGEAGDPCGDWEARGGDAGGQSSVLSVMLLQSHLEETGLSHEGQHLSEEGNALSFLAPNCLCGKGTARGRGGSYLDKKLCPCGFVIVCEDTHIVEAGLQA